MSRQNNFHSQTTMQGILVFVALVAIASANVLVPRLALGSSCPIFSRTQYVKGSSNISTVLRGVGVVSAGKTYPAYFAASVAKRCFAIYNTFTYQITCDSFGSVQVLPNVDAQGQPIPGQPPQVCFVAPDHTYTMEENNHKELIKLDENLLENICFSEPRDVGAGEGTVAMEIALTKLTGLVRHIYFAQNVPHPKGTPAVGLMAVGNMDLSGAVSLNPPDSLFAFPAICQGAPNWIDTFDF